MITQTLKLNLIPGQVLPRVNVSQYDAGTRTLQMLLYNGDQAFNIPTGYGGFVQGTKPDRTGFQYAATVTEGSNVVTLVVTQQMAAVSGEVTCELVIANGDDRIATVNFILYVEPAALADDTVISDTELPLIEEAAELAQRIDGITADVEADADRAEAAVEHYPYIGANGNWYVFDLQTEQFVDTTIAATGPQGATGPTGPQGPTGPTGNGIVSITKTGTSGLVDTYTITFTDGTTTTFTVTNGQDGQGSGDMTKAVYDSTNAVADAGGIVAYVASQAAAGSLSGLSDVSLSTLANGESLVYNSTSQKWENGNVSYSSVSGKPTLGTAAAKDSTNAVTSGSTDLVESGAVYTEIQTLTNQIATKADSSTVTALANDVDDISDEIADMNNVLGAKNLLETELDGTTFDKVNVTRNSNGTISVSTNGEVESTQQIIHIHKMFTPPVTGPYKLTGAYDENVFLIGFNVTDSIWTDSDIGNGVVLSLDQNKLYYFVIVVRANTTLSTPVIVSPMLRPNRIADDTYVPYAKTNRELTDDVTLYRDVVAMDLTKIATVTRANLYKQGHIVKLFADITVGNNDIPAWGVIGQLPSGFYETDTIYSDSPISIVKDATDFSTLNYGNYCYVNNSGQFQPSFIMKANHRYTINYLKVLLK